MVRFLLVSGSLLLGALTAPPVTAGQDPPRDGASSERPAGPVEAPPERPSEVVAVDPSDPFLNSYQFYAPRAQARALAKPQDVLEMAFGLSLADADDALRAQLEIPPGEGVVAVAVKAGSLADQAGLKTNDVMVAVGGQKAGSSDQVRKSLLGLGQEALEVKLVRQGKPARLSLVGPKHGFPPEAADYWIGVPVSPVDATLRSHLPSLAAGTGLVVNDVVKGSPAEKAEIRKNDILVALGGKPLKDSEGLIEQVRASEGKPVPLDILRAGKPQTNTIVPAKRSPVPTPIALTRNPAVQYRYQVVRPNMAIEVFRDPAQNAAGDAKPATGPAGSKPNGAANAKPATGPAGSKPQGQVAIHGFTYPQGDPNSTQMIEVRTLAAPSNDATARIEARLKEVTAELDKLVKTLEALKDLDKIVDALKAETPKKPAEK